MLVCLWKGCTFAFEELAAFQEHVITKHALQQQRQLNLDKETDVGIGTEKEQMVAEEQIIANLNQQEENKMIKNGAGKRKIIFLAIEVWVDVLGFVKRIQLARSVCMVNFKIYEICWPRLHGDKVMAHSVQDLAIGYCNNAVVHPPTALLLLELKKVPFPECSPPAYITGFEHIQIKFLDHQVLVFLSLIATRITTNKVRIHFTMEMSHLDKNQLASVNRLLQIFREKITTTISSMYFDCNLSNIPFLLDVDNKLQRIAFHAHEDSDILILMQFLASPRPDGKQRVIRLYYCVPVAQKMLDAIKEEFRTSTKPVPQPFYLQFYSNLNIPQSEEQNLQTGETLTTMPNVRDRIFCINVCRHPRGQHAQCTEDARKRLIELPLEDNSITLISVEISEFGAL